MSTPVSSSTSYASASDLLARYDARVLGDLVADAGARVSSVGLATDANLSVALKRASGEVEAACLVAGKYTPTDLSGLTGMAKELLIGLVCDVAAWFLMVRRYPDMKPTEAVKMALERLGQLREGVRIFGLQEAMDSGNAETTFRTQQQIDTVRLATTQARRFFGVRGKEARLIG